jgi:hypothetical protein
MPAPVCIARWGAPIFYTNPDTLEVRQGTAEWCNDESDPPYATNLLFDEGLPTEERMEQVPHSHEPPGVPASAGCWSHQFGDAGQA